MVLALLLPLSAQTPGTLQTPANDEPTFSTEVKVVNVLATVRTKSGQLINDLTKDDFSLAENKRPQDIRYFSRESDLPLTIGLMVDTSMSQDACSRASAAPAFSLSIKSCAKAKTKSSLRNSIWR